MVEVTGGNDSSFAHFGGSIANVTVSSSTADVSMFHATGDVHVGGRPGSAGGTATMTIDVGGEADVDQTMAIWNTGTVNLDGGTIRANTINHTLGGTFSISNGRLSVENFQGDLAIQGGTLAPGDSPGMTHVTGGYSQDAASTLEIEIGGLAVGSEFDQVIVTNSALLDGTLIVQLTDEFTPVLGDTFEVVTAAGGVDGMFASLQLPDLGELLAMDVIYDTNLVTLAVVPALSGDYNGDGVVDAADYTVWRDMLGSTTNLAVDGDGDNQIDAGDYDVWKNNFGASVAAGGSGASANAAVPEPATLVLFLLAAGWCLRRRSAA
jgi:hypothetical protein